MLMDGLSQMLENASGFLSARQPEETERVCSDILEKVPGQPAATHMLVFALLMQRETMQRRAIDAVRAALELNPGDPLLMATLGESYLAADMPDEAETVLNQLLARQPDHYYALLVMGKVLIRQARGAEAEKVLRHALTLPAAQGHDATYHALSRVLMPGENYQHLLRRFHQWLQPATYLEIGVQTGCALKLALPTTIAVGVDPNPILQVSLPETTQMFSMESDAFFEQHNLVDVMGHEALDFAFIDGLHVFDQVLRDFMNVEKFSRPNSVIVLHDVFPLDNVSSDPVRTTNFSTGDAWKVMAVLRKFRPDLTCFTIPAVPSGLGVVTNLDPQSTVLADNYDEAVATYQDKSYDWLMDAGLDETVGMFVNDWEQIVSRIGKAHAAHYG